MKRTTSLLTLLLILLLTLGAALADDAEIALTPMPDADAQSLLSQLVVRPWTDDDATRQMQCYDVNAAGEPVIGFVGDYARRCGVGVYTAEGKFRTGFSFLGGSAYYTAWTEDGMVQIYLTDRNTVATFTPDGSFAAAFTYANDKQTSAYFVKLASAERRVGGSTYTLEKEIDMMTMFSSGNNKLSRRDADGRTVILRDKPYASQVNLLFIGLLVIFAVVSGMQSLRGRKKK